MCEPQICRTDIVELDPSLFSTFNTSLNHFGLTSQSCKDMQQVNVRTYIYIIYRPFMRSGKHRTYNICYYVVRHVLNWSFVLYLLTPNRLDIQSRVCVLIIDLAIYNLMSWNHSSSFQTPCPGQCLCCLERRWRHHCLGGCYWRCQGHGRKAVSIPGNVGSLVYLIGNR